MITEQTKKVWYMALVAAIERIVNRRRPAKVHDFSQRSPKEFAFEQAAEENQAYMTGQGRGISRGDYILLQLDQDHPDQQPKLYQVQMIDYYSSPSDMWIALLVKAESPR
jgi:MioC protein